MIQQNVFYGSYGLSFLFLTPNFFHAIQNLTIAPETR